jgi:NADH-quinone oxidoreductase subunit H
MTDPITNFSEWITDLLTGWGLPPVWTTILLLVVGVVVLAAFVLLVDILLVWVERKVVARFQDRLGPNRLGPFGLIQPLADVIKLLIKEDITPNGADRIVFNLAPILTLAAVLLIWAVIPLAPTILGADINVAVLYIIAVGAIGTLSIIMAGWASNNKYALLGAFRTVAQMISYEVPMVIIILIPVLLSHSMGMSNIVKEQTIWYILVVPVAALIFLITSIAEIGRSPFDLIEAESEIVAGFHIEYTGMKFGLFYAGELLHALTIGAIFSTLFLGGWSGPGVSLPYVGPLLGVFYLFLKSFLIYFVIMWIKYSMPRIRIDHMLSFNWKFLTPIALALLVVVAILKKILDLSSIDGILAALILFTANILVAAIALALARYFGRQERTRVAEIGRVAAPPPDPTSIVSVVE